MLGNHADHFMLAQFNERVSAITPNAGGRSFDVPDRERAGTAHVTLAGGMSMPGPQRSVSSGFIPGANFVAPSIAAPQPSGAIPGMGADAVAPSLAVNLNTTTLIGWGVIAAGLIYFLGRRGGEESAAAPAVVTK